MARNPEAVAAAKRRYKEKNRERLRIWNREYAARKRREAGMCVRGTPESAERMRQRERLYGANHPNWKGDAVGYGALHRWVHRHLEKVGVCAQCGARPGDGKCKRTDWANLSGLYKRDLADWRELCVSCHKFMDLARKKAA